MRASIALLLLAASLHAVAAADSEVVAFIGNQKKDDQWKGWDWDAITVLGFWTTPGDDLRAQAKANNVRLFADSHLPDAKDWASKDKRKDWVKQKVAQVQSDKLDGVFFDFEGQINDDEKKAYTELAQETTAALKPLNASVFVCVGARPAYEFRSYDYSGLADAVDFLFIMGYDAHFWDDYTCVLKGTCSPAEASIKDLSAGVSEYRDKVDGAKLVLGLPWYGQRYTRVVLPINEGQIDYKDVLAVMDTKGRVKSKTLDKDSQTWKITCNGACVDGKKGGEIWIDDATTLAPKYELAKKNKLRGVGVWEADKLPTDGKHEDERKAMWAALAGWNGHAQDGAEQPACCFCSNGGDGSGACFEVSKCNAKASYSCHGTGSGGCEWVPQKGECV